MKTPKRIIPCPQCGAPCELGMSVIESWDERYEVPALFCTRSGEEVVGNAKAICARLTRKNRETRLRKALRKMNGILDYAAKEVQRMENEACEEYELQLRLRLSLAATRTLNNFQRGCIHASGAFGQDVEGS